MSIKNTSKVELHPEWLLGGNPRMIERQEARGQEELCQSSQLPQKDSWDKDQKDVYSKLGIKVLAKSKEDDLFYNVVLPNGWKIEPTEHSMWSLLKDETGKEVGSIFYKAAFYDRNAFFRLTQERE